MRTATGARAVVTILLLSVLSTQALANGDAGSGGDAGDSSSNATPLGPYNGTYNGNLTSGDEDWYSIQMPNGTGIAASLSFPSNSSNDFDLYLYDSSSNSLDYSWYSDPVENVTSNGSSVGGTTVTLWVDAFTGYGYYTLEIWIFPEDQGPPQNDAGTGTDAGDSSSNATIISSSNQTLDGWISDAWDSQDWYNISIPANSGISVSMSFPNGTSTNTEIGLVDSGSYYINYPNSPDSSSPYEVNSSTANVAGDSVFIRVFTTADEGNYSLEITLFSTSGQTGSSQNDANSGGDAGDALGSALEVNMSGNVTTFQGWVDNNWDQYDYYSIDVPVNWTSWASVSWNNSSADLDLALYSSSGSLLDYSTSSTSNPEEVSGNSSSIGGETIYYRIRSYSGSDVDYNLTIGLANLSDSPAYNQNDAYSGGDAGNNLSSALDLPINNQTQATFHGWISDEADNLDYYSVQVPPAYAIGADLSWNNSANDFDLYLYDSYYNSIDSSYSDNPETVQSGSTNVSNSTVYIVVESYQVSWWGTGGGEGNYTLNITLLNQSDVPGLNQNDAYSGGDAGDDISNATPLVNATTGPSIWPGYADSGSDSYDYYQLYVPVDHGITAELSPGYGQSTWLALSLYDSSNSQVDYDYYSEPQSVSSNGTGANLGGTNVVVEVWAYNGEDQYNLSLWIFSLDADGDGFYDDVEYACGSDPNDNYSIPADTDGDGICDALDEDIDGDGVDNANDSFPDDANETSDNDGDGTGDNSDLDDDNDGWSDSSEYSCGTDGQDSDSFPNDLDSDGVCDILDEDIDGDGYDNPSDSFDYDSSEWNDTDGDGIGDNSDGDDDGDGFYDGVEEDCLSDPLDPSSTPDDTDSDGVCDVMDDDVDGDGIGNDLDDFPFDDSESIDTDGDGIGDSSDPDDDNDGYQDSFDAFPLDSSEWGDNDGDLVGDNSDPDDDNDGWEDADEIDCGTNPSLFQSAPDDWDGDRVCDVVDSDDDNDAWNDTIDAFPFNPNEWDDLDGDNQGSNSDPDDDGDGWSDSDESSICGTDPRDRQSVPDDFDGDKICDNLDDDDDNDLVLDFDDDFPLDPTETKDTDGDGQGDGDDTDDDNDGWPDTTEAVCETSPIAASEVPADFDGDLTCDLIDPDDDNDGFIDQEDAFPFDSNEWADRNSDGLGDNSHPLSIMDKMKLSPGTSIAAVGILAAALSATMAFLFGRSKVREQFDEDQGWGDDEGDYYEDWEYQE